MKIDLHNKTSRHFNAKKCITQTRIRTAKGIRRVQKRTLFPRIIDSDCPLLCIALHIPYREYTNCATHVRIDNRKMDQRTLWDRLLRYTTYIFNANILHIVKVLLSNGRSELRTTLSAKKAKVCATHRGCCCCCCGARGVFGPWGGRSGPRAPAVLGARWPEI